MEFYFRAIPGLEAHELEQFCTAADHPYMSDRQRERLHRSLDRRKQREQPVVPVQVTSDEGAAIVGSLGIGVRIEKLEK